MSNANTGSITSLIVISGIPKAPASDTWSNPKKLYINKNMEIEIFTRSFPLRIKLGKENVFEKFKLMKNYINNFKKIDFKNIEYVDLRFKKPVISFKKNKS